jgi:hypothetical protein
MLYLGVGCKKLYPPSWNYLISRDVATESDAFSLPIIVIAIAAPAITAPSRDPYHHGFFHFEKECEYLSSVGSASIIRN